MFEELAEQATGIKGAYVYYIEGDFGPEYKLLVPEQGVAHYLGRSPENAEQALREFIEEGEDAS